jgi:hypothetical protein
MDLIRFEEAATELLRSLGDRLTADDHDYLGGYLWGGEEGLLADALAATLRSKRIQVSSTERALLRELLYSFDLEGIDPKVYPTLCDRDRVIAALNVVESADPR